MERTLLVIITVMLGLTLMSLWVVLYQVVKQQGRLLLRLDHVEHHTGLKPIAISSAANGPNSQQRGLAVGTHFPPFELPDISGDVVSLESFKGKRVLLVHWSPRCGFCDRIAPDLAGLQPDFSRQNVQLLLVSRGDAESNRKLAEEYGLECPILLLKDGTRAVEGFENFGTPVAYLLDEEGQVAEPLSVGADQVPVLARKAAAVEQKRKRLPNERPLAESLIGRKGLKAGTPAPSFSLPDVHGRMVSLQEYRGRQVLLVFTDPHCGPCDQLAPHLVRVHKEHRDNNLDVLLVGRGVPEENRHKVKEHGFDFPVVLQRKWEVSRQYGIFSTPVAFLIDENGVIARNVAKGVDQILTLAKEGSL